MKHDTFVSIPISLLCQANITPTQYTFLFLLHTKNWAALRDYVRANKGFPRHEVKDLNDRGFILHFNINPDLETSAENLYVTEKFTDLLYSGDNSLYVDSDKAFEELHSAYPPFIQVEGKTVAARNLDFDTGELMYSRIIRGKRELHKHVLEAVTYGKEHGLLNMGLKKFMETRHWINIRDLMEQQKSRRI